MADGAFTWKVLGTASAVTAGLAARKLLVTAFTKTTGKNPPANPEAPDTSWQQAVGWALLSGAVMGLARMLATRKAADFYQKATGHLPKNMQKVT
jgi:hypothetical protein